MKNILVTGGAGFIGSNFIHYALKRDSGVRIINLDALTYAGDKSNLEDLPDPKRHAFIKGDICDGALVNTLIRRFHVDTIVHFAAESHVDRSIDSPWQFMQTNVMGTFGLLERAQDHGIRFHHVSTDEVYGSLSPSEAPWTEESPYMPNSPYAASKAASDHLVRAYGHTYSLPVTISNCTNNYGPRQHEEKLIPLTITNVLKRRPIPVYGDGQQVRDWIHVEDHCEAIWLVLEKGRIGETYNIGGNNQPTNLEIVQRICDIFDITAPGETTFASLIEHVTDRLGHDRRYMINSRKAQRELGWFPRKSLADGLEETVKWYVERAKGS